MEGPCLSMFSLLISLNNMHWLPEVSLICSLFLFFCSMYIFLSFVVCLFCFAALLLTYHSELEPLPFYHSMGFYLFNIEDNVNVRLRNVEDDFFFFFLFEILVLIVKKFEM